MRFTSTSSLWLCLLASFLGSNNALIVSPRSRSEPTRSRSAKYEPSSRTLEEVSVARIRSARTYDIEPISELLAIATAGEETKNWKSRMERLRVKESVKTNIGLRLRAIEEGKRRLSERIQTTGGEINLEVNDPVHLRYLWTQDSFRNKVLQAAERSSEPTPWNYHNSALPPTDPTWLRHEMITAEETRTGKIVGFVEIAMLLCPSSTRNSNIQTDSICSEDLHEEELCFLDCAPTIANLVVAPEWRGLGVAKGLVKSAERFVQRKWGCDIISLYVEKQNEIALKLYSSVGYDVKSSLAEKDQPSKWYMVKKLSQDSGISSKALCEF